MMVGHCIWFVYTKFLLPKKILPFWWCRWVWLLHDACVHNMLAWVFLCKKKVYRNVHNICFYFIYTEQKRKRNKVKHWIIWLMLSIFIPLLDMYIYSLCFLSFCVVFSLYMLFYSFFIVSEISWCMQSSIT